MYREFTDTTVYLGSIVTVLVIYEVSGSYKPIISNILLGPEYDEDIQAYLTPLHIDRLYSRLIAHVIESGVLAQEGLMNE